MKRDLPEIRTQRANDDGFVLVGAVMLILALTILGLSLFNLSSYEAQFLHRSKDQLQALYHAQGGMERARYALSVHERLETVGENLSPHVIYAEAFQLQGSDTVSSGPIQYPSATDTLPVLVRVRAEYAGATRTIESMFIPAKEEDYYRSTISVADSMYVNDISGASNTNRCDTVIIQGGIRMGNVTAHEDTSWVDCMLAYNPAGIDLRSVSKPDVGSFFSAHPTGVTPAFADNGGSFEYNFSGGPTPSFYTWPKSDADFTLRDGYPSPPIVYINVVGHNVWMLSEGMRMDAQVVITGDASTSSLVIVAGRNGSFSGYEDAGIWFFGGVESQIPLILVSDGGVYIEQFQHTHLESQSLPFLSVYAGYAFVTGPQLSAGDALLILQHIFPMDQTIDYLAGYGALPGAASSSGKQFTFIPGSWQELASN